MKCMLKSECGYIGIDKQGKPTATTDIKRARIFDNKTKAKTFQSSLSKFLKKDTWRVINISDSILLDIEETSEEVVVQIENIEFDIDFLYNIESNMCGIESHIRNAYIQKQAIQDQLSLCDKKICDIMHKIEMSNFNASQGFVLCKMVKEARIERRQYKNALDILGTFFSLNLDNIVNLQTKKRIQALKERTYTPRILTELFE